LFFVFGALSEFPRKNQIVGQSLGDHRSECRTRTNQEPETPDAAPPTLRFAPNSHKKPYPNLFNFFCLHRN
jgi:hypothetical protein